MFPFFAFDSFAIQLIVMGIMSTIGLRFARNRTSTLVIQKYEVAVEPQQAPRPTVEIVGRMQGVVAFVLSLLGFSPIIRFTIAGSELRCQSSSLFGQRSQFIPLRCVSTVTAGIHKPISALVWAAFALIFGIYLSFANRSWAPIAVALIIAAVLLVMYVVSKKFFIEVYAQGGPSIALLFKPNVLEGVAIDVDQAMAVVDVIRDMIVYEGAAVSSPRMPPPIPAPYVEAPYEASAWASPTDDDTNDDEDQARQLLTRARHYAQQGEKDRAVSTLQEIVRRFPDTDTANQARKNLQKRAP